MKSTKMELDRWDLQPIPTNITLPRNGIRALTMCTPAGLLPPPEHTTYAKLQEKYDKGRNGDIKERPAVNAYGDEPPLTHVQQVAKTSSTFTSSQILLSQQPSCVANRRCCGARIYGPRRKEEYIRSCLPFQIEANMGLLDELETLEHDFEDFKSKQDKSEPAIMWAFLKIRDEAALFDVKLPRKKRENPEAEAEAQLSRPIMRVPKRVLTGPLGSFLTGHEYLLFATTCRTMITRALWIQGGPTVWHPSDVPPHRRMCIANMRDYLCLRRTRNKLCADLKPVDSECSHAIQRVDASGLLTRHRSFSNHILVDVCKGLLSDVKCFASNGDLRMWGLWHQAPDHFKSFGAFRNLQCLELCTMSNVTPDVMGKIVAFSALRTFKAPEGLHHALPEMLPQMTNLRHLDIRSVRNLYNDLNYPHPMGLSWIVKMEKALSQLTCLETLRIDADISTGGPFFSRKEHASAADLPAFAAKLTKLVLAIPYTTGVSILRRLRAQTTAAFLPKMRQLEIVFSYEDQVADYFRQSFMEGVDGVCSQVTDLHIMTLEWDYSERLPIGFTEDRLPADVLHDVYPNLTTLRLSGTTALSGRCNMIPSYNQGACCRTEFRWPANIHIYTTNERENECKHDDVRKPRWIKHWMPQQKDPIGTQQEARAREQKHSAELHNDSKPTKREEVVQQIFKNHLLRGGVSPSPTSGQGNTLHIHRGTYWQERSEHDEKAAAQHALDFKVEIDAQYCAAATAAERDAVFRRHIAQLKFTVYALDNCACVYHDTLRFLRMLTMLRHSEFVRSLMQLVFEKTLLIETGHCDNKDLKEADSAWISSAGRLSPAVGEAFHKQWKLLTDGLGQTVEGIHILLLNYMHMDDSSIHDKMLSPSFVLPDQKQTRRSFDVMLRLILLVGSLTKSLIESIPLVSMRPVCNKITALETDVMKSCDRLFTIACKPVDTLFDMDEATEQWIENNPNESVKTMVEDTAPGSMFGLQPTERKEEVAREAYNMDLCSHKEMYFFSAFLVITDIVEHEDFLRSHITEISLGRWFASSVWQHCDMQQEADLRKVKYLCVKESPNGLVGQVTESDVDSDYEEDAAREAEQEEEDEE